jgi:hypothetical protein
MVKALDIHSIEIIDYIEVEMSRYFGEVGIAFFYRITSKL